MAFDVSSGIMKPIPADRHAEIDRIVYELETAEDRCAATQNLQSPEELLELARSYNWGDGMEVPRAIIDHPRCDLGLALHMFELAEGTVWITKEVDPAHNETWSNFCQDLSSRIQGGRYPTVDIPFQSEFMKVQKYKARKAGVPDIFLDSVHPQPAKS